MDIEQERQTAMAQLDRLVKQREMAKKDTLAEAANWNYAKGLASKSPSKYSQSMEGEDV